MNRLTKLWRTLLLGLGELSPNCKEATHLQSAALDRRLRPGQRIGLHIHLFLCKWCRRYGKQLGFLRSAARQHADHESSLPLRSLGPEARERIKRRLQEEEK